jgi:hypothetical protein
VNRFLLIALYYFTKWLVVYAAPNQEAPMVINILLTNVFYLFGA